MIPFVLGVITGFLFAIFLLVLYAVVRASGEANRREEEWEKNDDVHGYAEPTSTEKTV